MTTAEGQQAIFRQQRRRALVKRIDYYPSNEAVAVIEAALACSSHRNRTQLLNAIVREWAASGSRGLTGDSEDRGFSPQYARAREVAPDVVAPSPSKPVRKWVGY